MHLTLFPIAVKLMLRIVSVKSTVSISMPLSTMAQPPRYTAMTRCVPQLPTAATRKPPVLLFQ